MVGIYLGTGTLVNTTSTLGGWPLWQVYIFIFIPGFWNISYLGFRALFAPFPVHNFIFQLLILKSAILNNFQIWRLFHLAQFKKRIPTIFQELFLPILMLHKTFTGVL